MTAVVVTWNSERVIASCLDALQATLEPGGWRAVVVDNGSIDATLRIAAAHPGPVEVIANASNRGLAAANNQGIAVGASPFVLVCNPDALVQPGAVGALLDLMGKRPRAAFAIPRVHGDDGRLHTSVGDLPGLGEALLGRQFRRRRRGAREGFWWDGWPHDEERRVGRGHECCYLVRREAVDEIGLQDEEFFLDWEGVEWAARAAAAGWEVWFTPRARVVHLGGESIRRAPVAWIIGTHRGMYRYFSRRLAPPLRPPLAFLVAVRGMLKAVAAAIGPAAYRRANPS